MPTYLIVYGYLSKNFFLKFSSMKTYLNNNQIERLANVFANEEKYTEHLKTLWALRDTLSKKMDYPNLDVTNPLFKIWELSNDIIGAIDDGRVTISNGRVLVYKHK